MERLTKRNFNFTSDFIASHLHSWSIARALSKLQEYENKLEDLGMTLDELIARLPRCEAPAVSDKDALVIQQLRDGKNWGYAYVYHGELPETFVLDLSPENIARFLIAHRTALEILVTNALDVALLSSYGEFINKIEDMDLRSKIIQHLMPEAEPPVSVSKDLFDWYCENTPDVNADVYTDAKHPLHEELAKTSFQAKRGKSVKIGDQEVTEYCCPHCDYKWLEYSDMPEYPYHCPGCGESLWREEVSETSDTMSDTSILETDDTNSVFAKVKAQLNKHIHTTQFGDYQAMLDLPNQRVLEFTLEKEMLPPGNYCYSVQLHCNAEGYEAGYYKESGGVIRTIASKGTQDSDLLELIETVLMCDKYTPVKV